MIAINLRTSAARNLVVRTIGNGVVGLAAGAFASSAIFDATIHIAPYWSGLWTGVICTATTLFGAGLGLTHRPTF